MKTFVLATCLLATVIYAVDHEQLKHMYELFNECIKHENITENVELRPDVWFCVLSKRGVIDENDVIVKEEAMSYCEAVTICPQGCKKIVTKCIREGNQVPGSNKEKSLATLECDLKSDILNLVPKRE
ncbi:PREDICTED: venom allergen 2-like [Vollenhovia emeryi]|uniref:venom allergen 2-like n=1 Tax=Vollenhovia emeryi TaxID=411798 RepID=UPI0005F3937A|nr:PREDICTED: venom allergen 2-like [Vollenhovia emeryi]